MRIIERKRYGTEPIFVLQEHILAGSFDDRWKDISYYTTLEEARRALENRRNGCLEYEKVVS